MNTQFTIGTAHEAENQEWKTGRKSKFEDLSSDPVAKAFKTQDFKFLTELLKPRVEKELRSRKEFSDREDLVISLTPTVLSCLYAALGAVTGTTHSYDQDNLREMQFRFPNELNLLIKAAAMRNGGKSDAEILELLTKETAKAE